MGDRSERFSWACPSRPFWLGRVKKASLPLSSDTLPFFHSIHKIIIPLYKSPWQPPRPSLVLPKADHRTSAAPRQISTFLSYKVWTMNYEQWMIQPDHTNPFLPSCMNIFTIKMQPFLWLWIMGVGCFYETSGFMGHAASRSGGAVKMMWLSTLFSNHGHSHCQ